MNEQTQTIIASLVTVIITNWVTIVPILKTAIKTFWEKSIEWRDMVNDIKLLKDQVEKLKKDLTAAHNKIRDLSTKG